jgi:hypothetical protein
VLGIFEIGSWELFAQGWLWNLTLLISASWVARVTGVSHWLPASACSKWFLFNWEVGFSELVFPRSFLI